MSNVLDVCKRMKADARVVEVDVDAVCCGLLEREDVDCDAVQDVSCGCKETDEVPALLLIGLKYTSQHWD